MCPACIATVALLIAGAVSTGGAAAVVAEKMRGKTSATKLPEKMNQQEKTSEQCATK